MYCGERSITLYNIGVRVKLVRTFLLPGYSIDKIQSTFDRIVSSHSSASAYSKANVILRLYSVCNRFLDVLMVGNE